MLFSGGKTPDVRSRTYIQIAQEQALKKQQKLIHGQLSDLAKAGELKVSKEPVSEKPGERKRRWDLSSAETVVASQGPRKKIQTASWDNAETPAVARWDETPGRPKV